MTLTPEQASELYAEHFGKPFFPNLIAYMSSGPVVALVLAREKAVTALRELMGPTNAVKARTTHPNRQVFDQYCMCYTQWSNCKIRARGTLSPPPFPSLPFLFSLPLPSPPSPLLFPSP